MIKIIIALIILIYASLLDWKYREIDDKSWLSMFFLGTIFLFHDYFKFKSLNLIKIYFFSIAIAFILAAFLYYSGLMGGGDGKILVGIASMFPYFPYKTFSIFPLFVLSVFSNAIVVSLAIPLVFFFYNLGRGIKPNNLKEFFMLFLGYKKKIADMGEFEVIMDKIFIRAKDIDMYLDSKGKEKVTGDEEVWVTPALPFVIPITIGFLISLKYGDLISFIVVKLYE